MVRSSLHMSLSQQPPPAGGFGVRSSEQGSAFASPRAPKPRQWGVAIAAVAIVCALVAGGIRFMKRYVGNAKTAEARHELARIGDAALAAYGRDGRICPSASRPIPERMPEDCRNGMTGIYTSRAADWTVDKGQNAGFACLGFEIQAPQYYRYEYLSTDRTFVARASSCMPELVTEGAFEIRGRIEDGKLVVGPVSRIPTE
jgi:hypothetical protein